MTGEQGARGEPAAGAAPGRRSPPETLELLDMIWPETGLQTAARVPRRPKDGLRGFFWPRVKYEGGDDEMAEVAARIRERLG